MVSRNAVIDLETKVEKICDTCQLDFSNFDEISKQNHSRKCRVFSQFNDGEHQCTLCLMICEDKVSFFNHMNSNHIDLIKNSNMMDGTFKDCICGQSVLKEDLMFHIKSCQYVSSFLGENGNSCNLCQKIFYGIGSLYVHVKKIHADQIAPFNGNRDVTSGDGKITCQIETEDGIGLVQIEADEISRESLKGLIHLIFDFHIYSHKYVRKILAQA